MTKEEMAKAYAEGFEDKKYGEIAYTAFLCGFTAKCESSLPSNLDEAAEEYAYNNWEDNDYHTGASEGLPFDAIGHTEKCFKAGAEWMARQGYIKEGIARPDDCEIWVNIANTDIKDGDKVIVQIRKKQ